MTAWQQALQNTLPRGPVRLLPQVPDRPLDHASVREFARRIRAMRAQGYEGHEIAEEMRCSKSTVWRHLKGKK